MRSPFYIVASIALWSLAVFFLWMPGLGNQMVPHTGDMKQSHGLLGYYVIRTVKGRLVYEGFDYLSLFTTIGLTLLMSALVLIDIMKPWRPGSHAQGAPETNGDGNSTRRGLH